ncbi:MAG: hypothetical protein JG766_2236 [Desulfacinum sp.]|jgi:hypothetical protein|nr:hypothetical protein [Desulfacinum sp.]
MEAPASRFHAQRLERCGEALERNHFRVSIVSDPEEAHRIVMDRVAAEIRPRSVSWGDSMTLHACGILESIARIDHIRLIRTFEPGVPRPEIIERRRQALLVDLFLTGTNAVTETGQLVNLDMVGNRVAGLTFGPRQVVVVAGRNKIVPDLAAARERIRTRAAPLNAMRHEGFRTPCRKTGTCMDCNSPDRICNTWAITEKSFPKGRIHVVLIHQDLGL